MFEANVKSPTLYRHELGEQVAVVVKFQIRRPKHKRYLQQWLGFKCTHLYARWASVGRALCLQARWASVFRALSLEALRVRYLTEG